MKVTITRASFIKYASRLCVILFIAFFLFCEGMDNFHVVLPPADNAQTLQSDLYRKLLDLVGILWNAGMVFSIAEHWTMYSYSFPMDSQLLILGVNKQGAGVVLPIPTQSSRSFWEANLLDYHENKLLEVAFRAPELRTMLAQSMCHQYGKRFDLKSIVFISVDRKILPWDEAVKVHRYYDNVTTQKNCGVYPCSE